MFKACVSTSTLEERNDISSILEGMSIPFLLFSNKAQRGWKFFSWFYCFYRFCKFLKKNNISVIIGGPSSRNRYASKLMGIPFASYMRSVHPDPAAITSLSDLIYHKLKFLKISWLNPYEANIIFVSTKINREFLIHRGISNRKIHEIGAYWLHHKKVVMSEGSIPSVIYITQSFSEHRNAEAAGEQLNSILRVKAICAKESLRFILRKHPRDSFNYSGIFLEKEEIDQRNSTDFLFSITKDDILVGSFSTMMLEAMAIGAKILPIHLENNEKANALFKKFGMIPIGLNDLEEKNLKDFPVYSLDLFSSLNVGPVRDFCMAEGWIRK